MREWQEGDIVLCKNLGLCQLAEAVVGEGLEIYCLDKKTHPVGTYNAWFFPHTVTLVMPWENLDVNWLKSYDPQEIERLRNGN